VARIAAITGILRRARAERGVLLTLFGLVAVTSLVVAISPRLFERVADDGLRYDVGLGTSAQRDLHFATNGQIRARDDDPMQSVRARGEDIEARLPASVHDLIDQHDFVIETPRFRLTDPPAFPTFMTLRYQDGVADRLMLDEGRLPNRLDPATDPEAPPRFEIAISSETSATTHVELGQVLPASLDVSDPLVRLLFPRPTADVELQVVGLFSVTDPDDPAWFDDLAYARPGIGGSQDVTIAFATALFASNAYPQVAGLGLPTRNRWRYHVDPARLDAGQLEQLVPDLRRLDTAFSPGQSGESGQSSVSYRSGLLSLIERHLERRASTEAVLSVAAMGPLAVAAGALGLVAAIVIRRRRMTLALARGRGASARQLLAAQLWEGMLVTAPAAVAGLLVARAMVPARADPESAVGAVVVAGAVTGLLVLATWPRARRARRDIERIDLPVRRPSPRRLVFEATIVVVALAAAWLLRERGLRADTATGSSFDPLIAASPILIGLATALLTIRLYPLPVRALSWLSARRRDLVPALGLRTIGRDPGTATLPLLIVTVTVAIGVFSSVLGLTIERGQVLAGWQEVGADYRAESASGTDFSLAVDPSTVDGVDAIAPALVTPAAHVTRDSARSIGATLVAVDPTAFAAVLRDAPLAPPSAAAFADAPTGPDAGSADRPIPVVVSRRLPDGWPALAPGDTFTFGVRNQLFEATVSHLAEAMPGLPVGASFVVAPLASVAAGWDGPAFRVNTFFIRAPEPAAPGLRAAVGSSAELTSRHAMLAAQRDAPLVAAISRGFGIALVAAALYAALAIVAVSVLDVGRRSRELAYLRILGLTRRQSVSLTFVEHAPPTALALGIGVVLGLAVAWLTEPGLGLDAYIGRAVPVRLQVDWTAVGIIAGTVVGVIVLMVAASSWLARRLEPAEALRVGDA
jgi:putative ABC transport system permease protein